MRHRSKKGQRGRGKKVSYFGIAFDSQIEGERYLQLRSMAEAGDISNLMCQPKFVLQDGFTDSDGKRVRAITYTADFQYTDSDGNDIVEDVKPSRKAKAENTREGTLRVKMFKYKFRQYQFRLVAM